MSQSDRIASTCVVSCADVHQQGMLEWDAGNSEVHVCLSLVILGLALGKSTEMVLRIVALIDPISLVT